LNGLPADTANSSIVTVEVATDIAKDFFRMYYDNVPNRDIEGYTAAEEEKGKPLFYVFNFKGGGFLILSGDYNETPILANSAKGAFALKGEVNPNLFGWINAMSSEIRDIRRKTLNPREGVEHVWNDLKSHKFKTTFQARVADSRNSNILDTRGTGGSSLPPPVKLDCGQYHNIQIGPLLTTTWGQGCFYNSEIPYVGNSCNRAPTGCAPTAMAQVMRYYNSPSNTFNFSLMPNQLTFNSTTNAMYEVAHLMERCGNALGMVAADYTPTASSALPSKFKPAFEGYGYSHEIMLSDYDESLHMWEINAYRPVILTGYSTTTTIQDCFLFWCRDKEKLGGGHGWVSDGYQDIGDLCHTQGVLFSMNWGWSNEANENGFYIQPEPRNRGTGAFQFNRGILHHIHL
jgi:Peptidase C10 family/Spi protease inhibitor